MKNGHVTKITARLPPNIKKFSWTRNHHFLELEDEKGNRTKLNASGVLIGSCLSCKERCLALTNQGNMSCTHCGGAVKWAWTKLQLAFIPEHESKFMGIHEPPRNKKK